MQLFDKGWFAKHQKLLLWGANTWIGRKILCIDGEKSSVGKNKILRIDPNAIIWFTGRYKIDRRFRNPQDHRLALFSAEFRTHDKFGKRLYYAFKPLWHLFHFWDMNFANLFMPTWNLGFDSTGDLFPAAGAVSPVDGYVAREGINETFADIRGGAGNTARASNATEQIAGLTGTATANQYGTLARGIALFNTSVIGSSSTVDTVVISIEGSQKFPDLGTTALTFTVVASTPAANDALANADYGQLGTVEFGNISYASYSTIAYNDITLEASGRANIVKDGISKFGFRISWDTANNFQGTWASGQTSSFYGRYADTAGTGSDPKLVVTYTSVPSVTSWHSPPDITFRNIYEVVAY